MLSAIFVFAVYQNGDVLTLSIYDNPMRTQQRQKLWHLTIQQYRLREQ